MARTFREMWTGLIFVFVLAATALAQSPVSDDTFVTSASPSSTNGTSPSLVVQAPAGWTFIKLDLSRLPAGTQSGAISKATLKLYVTAATAQGAFDVFRVDSTWKEANLTYSNSTAPNQSAQALVLTPISTGTCSGTPVQCVTTTSKYIIVDVTNIVRDWLNFQNGVGGSHANNGIAFKPSSGSSISVTFESKESTTTGHDSDLEIDYATSLASIPGTIGPSQVDAGTYAINISGTAATASQFDHITNQCAANLFAIGVTTAGHANCSQVLFSNLGGTVTNAQLPAAIVFNNQANTFGAGFKQTFTPSPALAGLNVVGAASDPTSLSNGDFWFNTGVGRLNFRSAGVTKQLAFLDDVSSPTNIQNSQLAHSSVTINSGSGLTGGGTVSLGNALTLSIPNAGISNAMLQNSSIGVTAGTGIAVVGTTSLGGAFSITNSGVLSFNGRSGAVAPQNNDYSFAQLSGADSATSHLIYNNQSNTFGINFRQIFQAGNNFAGLNIAGVSTDPNSANLQPGDLWFNTASNHLNFRDGSGNTKALAFTGDAASGDGSGLTNLNASQLSSGTVPTARLSGTYSISISGNAASITGGLPESQVTNLTTDLGNLSSNLSSEASTRASGDTNLQNNINAESAMRSSADTTLSASIGAETSRAQGAEATITGNLNNEITRATAAEGTKADLVKPVQLDNTAAVNGSCSTVNGLVLNPNQPSGQQMFICRDIGGGTLQWELINDDATSTAADHTYTDQQVAAEASARTSADNAEAAARQSADTALEANIDGEATARTAADTALQNNINSETSRAQGAESTITTNLNNEITRATGVETAEAATRAAADASLGAAIAAETTRATGAETTLQNNVDTLGASAAKVATDNTFSGQNTFTGPKIDMSGAAATLPVQTTNTPPPSSGHANACLAGQMLLQVNGAAGQQLFICNSNLDGWVMVNDDTTSTAADHTYTDQQVAAEASTRSSADNAEAAARQSADTTLQANIDAEAASRVAADTTLQNNINTETSRAQGAESTISSNLNGEISRATSTEAALGASIAAETTRAQGAESNITTNLTSEIARATAAEATKADLVKPVQLDNTAAVNGSCTAVNALILNPAQPSGQQLFICRDISGGTLQWQLINDDAATTAADHTYTDQQIEIEAAARTSADNAEAATRQAADTTLQNNIDTEVSRAQSAEASEVAARTAADNAEATTRAAADATLSAAVTAETSRATGAETTLQTNIDGLSTSSAKLTTDNIFTGNNTFSGAKVDMSGATSTLPVQTTNTTPPASGQANACVAGQMLLQVNGAPGQQLFICNANLDGWVMVNDDTTSTAADHTYTDQQVAIEAAARTSADNAEAAARQAADTTLQANIDAEAAVRAAADTAETNRATAAETSISNSVTAESARAITTETALGASIAAETTRAQGAESTITTNLNGEIARATAAEATKADLVKPVQLDNAAAVNGSCTTVNALVLNPNQSSGQQLFICRDMGSSVLEWQLINDDAASTAADHTYTDQQVAAEASARTSADNAEASARQAADTTLQANIDAEAAARAAAVSAEASARQAADATLQNDIDAETAARQAADTTLQNNINAEAATRAAADAAEAVARVAGDAASVATANAYTDGAVTTINSTLATKANLTGGNSFTGGQTVNGTLSLPAVGSGPSASRAFDMAGADGNNQPTLFRWQVNSTGLLNLFTATSGNPAQDSGLKIGSDGKITFASGQTFPGTQSSLTAGTGISILSNTIGNTGVLSFNGRNGAISPALGDYSFAQISGTFTPSQAGAGSYGIDISGNAATATSAVTAASATTAGSAAAVPFSGVISGSNTNALTIGNGGSLSATGTGVINATQLGGVAAATYVRNDQANTYTAGSKQTFKASATLAGLNIFGVATDPSGPLAAGDGWYNTTANRLKFYNGTVSKNVAFTDDSITGNASTASAFDHTPTQCTTNNFATGITATGNASCSQPSFTNLSGQATNSQLQNSSVTVTAGTGLSGGGSVSLGGSVTLSNSGVTSLTGTANQVSVSSSTGAVTLSLPATINVNTSGNAATAGALSGTFGIPVSTTITTSQSTTSTSYTDLGTVGPAVTATISASGRAMLTITGQETVTGSGVSCFMSIAVSGATTLTPSDTQAFVSGSDGGGSGGNASGPSTTQASATYLLTGLTAGSNTFTAKYKASSTASACTFANRDVIVTPY